ncbi:RICIN domain-containing protein [Kutzneria sp. NPDC052558]|uniref:RICIN domain-containing protein n=1 Tax=Kutzneria sp. NPDC052558 TaxID=3364121 RepID=UPI0037CC9E57
MSRPGRLGVVAIVVPGLVMALTATPASADTDWYQFVSKWSGKCMDLRDQEADSTTPHVQQWSCKDNVSNQQWSPVLQTNGTTSFVSKRTGKCLSVDGHADFAGALLVTQSCFAADAWQQWRFVTNPFPNASGSAWLVNAHSGKCVELPGWNTDNGLLLAQSDCVGGWKQYWNSIGL